MTDTMGFLYLGVPLTSLSLCEGRRLSEFRPAEWVLVPPALPDHPGGCPPAASR